MTNDMIVSISAVVARIKTIVSEIEVHKVWIQGEVSNLTKHRSGHYYFSIKDAHAELSCVMFASYVNKLSFSLEEGMKVLVKGSLNLYEQRGSLQLYVRTIKQDGIGDLFLEFEKRKKKLYELGYFDEGHKTKKPEFIEKIALITAKEGAALHDVMSTIQKRWPMMKVTLFPSYVQGSLAPASIVKQIKKADNLGYDAILVVRGGGSFEDLFCFNDEEIVKTIYSCKTYVVSGVGHEVDTTLCDLVSDHRAVTPTAAAQWVTLDQYDVYQTLSSIRQSLILSMQQRLNVAQSRFLSYNSNPYLQDPMSWLLEKRLRLDHVYTRLENQKEMFAKQNTKIQEIQKEMNRLFSIKVNDSQNQIDSSKKDIIHAIEVYHMQVTKHLKENEGLLDAYSPLKVLSRGYSITTHQDKIIRNINDIDIDEIISTRVNDGHIISKVIKKENTDGN